MAKGHDGIGFVLASTDLGAMIVNRFDFKVAPSGGIHASDPCTEIGRDPPRPAGAVKRRPD